MDGGRHDGFISKPYTRTGNNSAQDGLVEYSIEAKPEIKKIFEESMDSVAQKSEYNDNVKEELSEINLLKDQKDIEEILNKFYNLNENLKKKAFGKKAEEIFKNIPMKMEVFYDKFAKECMNVPIFKYYDVFQMFQRISCASNEDIVTIKEMLADRAKKYTKEIEPEIKNIKKLKQIVDEYIEGKEPTIKIVMLEEFAKELENIIDLYKPNFLSKKD